MKDPATQKRRRKSRLPRLALLALAAGCGRAESGRQEATRETGGEGAPPPATVHIVVPSDRETLAGPDVRVVLEAGGLEIVPAGTDRPGTGHHHLIVDADLPALGVPIPAEPDRYIHLGQGQTEYVLTGLEPGEHRVIALIGDYAHVPLDPPVADTVTFIVR